MAGYKETPRQKMIAMMYLVLTALLALNVSVEIIEAFVVVNSSIEGTNKTFKAKNDELYARFEQQNLLNEKKVGPYWAKAQEVRKISEDMVKYIEDVKWTAISRAEGITKQQASATPLGDINARSRYDETTNYFIGNSQDGSKGEARTLKNKINQYKIDVVKTLDENTRESIKLGLVTDGEYRDASGARQNWEMHNFYHTILAANVTFLNKLIVDVRTTESDIVSQLFNSITASDYKFDMVAAKVIPNSRLVFSGDTYEAEILVAAIDSKQNPDVVINGRTIPAENGVAKYTVGAGATGLQQYRGSIKVKDPISGQMKEYPFEESYFVMTPSLTVAPTKMNVFYANVDNPVSISASGIPESQISASISSGTIRKSGKEWVVRVPSGVSKAVVSVTHNDGKTTRNMGKAEFRVKRVPDPKAYIANTDGGAVPKSMLLASRYIIPKMPDDFDFDLTFTITSFTFVSVRGGDAFEEEGKGNALSQKMQTFISNSKRGQRIWLENIMAKGPDGNRKLGTISLIVQ